MKNGFIPLITALALCAQGVCADQAARITDPTAGGGTIVTGSSSVFIGGLGAARLNDQIVTPRFIPPATFCVGGPIVTGSATVLIDGRRAARRADIATTACGPEAIVGGSPTVIIGN